jgi:hypothetical protein
MNMVIIGFGTGVALIILVVICNKFSLKYNHGILRNAVCKNCSEVLGNESLNKATEKLERELEQYKRDAKLGTFKLHNMELICPHCGVVNLERELYHANRKR